MAKKTDIIESIRNNRLAPRLFVIAGLVVFGVSGWLWWSKVYTNPSRVFYDMINQSLRTSSVTRKVSLQAKGTSLAQIFDLSFGTQNKSHKSETLKQASEQVTAQITTESFGTPQEDYTRFVAIDTKETNEQGKLLDFSELIGVWGKSDEPGSGQTNFSETLFGAVPMANLPPQKRAELVNYILKNNVFEIDYRSFERSWVNGRQIYIYPVTIKEETYKPMLQEYTRLLGLRPEDGIDLSSNEGFPPLEMELAVDVLSRQLRSVRYASNGRFETYSGYGLKRPINLPKETIPVSELKKRLQTIR